MNLTDLFSFEGFEEFLPYLLRGALVTIGLTIIVAILSLIFGLALALLGLSRYKVCSVLAHIYVECIRGTPLILQLFYIYFVLPVFGIQISAFWAAVLALTLNYGAYISEVFRAGIAAVPRGQLEAANALGLGSTDVMRFIVVPQAIKIVIPPLGNYFLALFKDTALASTITVHELMFNGQAIASNNFNYFPMFTAIGLIYLLISYPASLGVRYLEASARQK